MIDLIHHNGNAYPAFQATGNAARFIIPFAREVCHGTGFDIGCNRPEWALPGAICIDPALPGCEWHATHLPQLEWPVDYIFSSHCLEHLPDWVGVLNYWIDQLCPGGVLFLYLPHYSQSYWRPWNNRKHVNILTPEILTDYLHDKGMEAVMATGPDLNSSFAVMAQKPMAE